MIGNPVGECGQRRPWDERPALRALEAVRQRQAVHVAPGPCQYGRRTDTEGPGWRTTLTPGQGDAGGDIRLNARGTPVEIGPISDAGGK